MKEQEELLEEIGDIEEACKQIDEYADLVKQGIRDAKHICETHLWNKSDEDARRIFRVCANRFEILLTAHANTAALLEISRHTPKLLRKYGRRYLPLPENRDEE